MESCLKKTNKPYRATNRVADMLEDNSGKTSQGTTNARIDHKLKCLGAMFQSVQLQNSSKRKHEPTPSSQIGAARRTRRRRKKESERASHRISFPPRGDCSGRAPARSLPTAGSAPPPGGLMSPASGTAVTQTERTGRAVISRCCVLQTPSSGSLMSL